MSSFLHPGLAFVPGLFERLWTPDNLASGLYTWTRRNSYNAAQSRWDDISGNDRHFVPLTTFPTASTNTVDFDGASNGLLTNNDATVDTPLTWFILLTVGVYDVSEDSTINQVVDGFIPGRTQFRRRFDASRTQVASGSVLEGPTVSNGETMLISAQFDTGANGTLVYKNGGLVLSGDTNPTLPPRGFCMGVANISGGQRYSQMSVYEFLAVPGILVESERQQTEGYICHNNGLASLLPVNHPYKDNSPTA